MNTNTDRPDDESLADQRLGRALKEAWEEVTGPAPRQHRLRTPDCPPLPRFAAAALPGWTDAERAHASQCAYCQKVLQMARRQAQEADPAPEPASSGKLRRLREVPQLELHAAASASCAGGGPEGRMLILEGGYRLHVFPQPGHPERTTLKFDGGVPPDMEGVLVDGRPIELPAGFDKMGYAVARTEDVRTILSGLGSLEIDVREAEPC